MPIRPTSPTSSTTSTAATTATTATGFADAGRAWAEAIDVHSAAARRLAIARTKAPTAGPAAVQRAFALYKTWEDRDLGSARLLKADVDGKDLWAIHTTTDGDASFLELFSGRGALLASGVVDPHGAITWDGAAGAVRDRVAPKASPATVASFHGDVGLAEQATSPSGDRVAVDEMKRAALALVGAELSTASVDGSEAAALQRVLADAHLLTPAARSFALRLGSLYVGGAPKELRRAQTKTLADVAGLASPAALAARVSTAEVKGRGDAPRIEAFTALARTQLGWLPTQLVPATRTAALDALKDAGLTSAEARAALDALGAAVTPALLFAGKLYEHDASSSASVPRLQGVGVFAATPDGKRVASVVVPVAAPSPPSAVHAAIASLTGVDRPADVVTAVTAGAFALEWRPPSGGLLQARLDLTDPTRPKIESATTPAVLEVALRDALAQHVASAVGHAVSVLGWVGRDDAQGPGFIVAHAPASGGPATLAHVRIALGGAATVTPKQIGASASDRDLARDLALVLARAHAQSMVDDPAIGPDARLEVALRTGWRTTASLEVQSAGGSPVGFDPQRERAQWMLPNVWGDNAVVVTFANDGGVRVEDVN